MSVGIKEAFAALFTSSSFLQVSHKCLKYMCDTITLLGTIGSWAGSIAAQATTIIIKYIYNKVT